MKIYISRAKGLAVEPILAHLKPLIEKANFKSVEYFWYQEGTTYSSKALEEADMVIVISDESCGLDNIGKGVYNEVEIAAEHDIEVFTFTPCDQTGDHFLQNIDVSSDLCLHDEKNWSDYGSISMYYDSDSVNSLTNDDIAEDVSSYFSDYYGLSCFKGYGDSVTNESSNTKEFKHGDTIIVTSSEGIGRFSTPQGGIKMGDKFTVHCYDDSDHSVSVFLPDGYTWWLCASLFQIVNTEETKPSQPTPSYSKVLEEINCDEDYLLLR